MPRFGDGWVVDRTMFEYVNGGSCACCGLSHLFSPDGLKGLIDACTDLETDAADNELQAAERSVWPPQLREQVWADRVRLRTKMKMEMKTYKQFFQTFDRKDVQQWCLTQLHHSDRKETTSSSSGDEVAASEEALKRLFQMPRNEIGNILRTKYNIHSAYAVVMCAVAEQVANFELTTLETDARGKEEVAFEHLLGFDRRGGFILPIATSKTTSSDAAAAPSPPTRSSSSSSGLFGGGGGGSRRNLQQQHRNNTPKTAEETLELFLDYMVKLGGPKLLEREFKSDEDDEEGGADDAPKTPPKKSTPSGPSFRSDRRMVRLLIARYWASTIMEKYKASHANESPEEEEEEEKEEREKEEEHEEEEKKNKRENRRKRRRRKHNDLELLIFSREFEP